MKGEERRGEERRGEERRGEERRGWGEERKGEEREGWDLVMMAPCCFLGGKGGPGGREISYGWVSGIDEVPRGDGTLREETGVPGERLTQLNLQKEGCLTQGARSS